jgi:hypothetical protein
MMWIFSKLDKNIFEILKILSYVNTSIVISVDQISHMLIAFNNNTYMFS